jgi:hypothetical protein
MAVCSQVSLLKFEYCRNSSKPLARLLLSPKPSALVTSHATVMATERSEVAAPPLANISHDQVQVRQDELRMYAERNEYASPTESYYLPGYVVHTLERPPLPNTHRTFYPGLLRIGRHLFHPDTVLWSGLEKITTLSEQTTHWYIEQTPMGFRSISDTRLNSEYFQNLKTDEWVAQMIARGSVMKPGSIFRGRVKLVTCMALSFAGLYDGPIVNNTANSSFVQQSRLRSFGLSKTIAISKRHRKTPGSMTRLFQSKTRYRRVPRKRYQSRRQTIRNIARSALLRQTLMNASVNAIDQFSQRTRRYVEVYSYSFSYTKLY